jgi:hypothetical protein
MPLGWVLSVSLRWVPNRVSNPVFDDLFARAEPAIRSGAHQRDTPPVDGGRWPVTVLARPPRPVRGHLESVMREALQFAGPDHFVTGRADSVHLTVRALEPYREQAAPTDPVADLWRSAIARTAMSTRPFTVAYTGITLTPGGVMAQVEALDEQPWQVMQRLREMLGAEAWYEDGWMQRNIWYASLVHFAADIRDPGGLVDWARTNRSVTPIEFTVRGLELVRSCYVDERPDGERLMRPESWYEVPFTGS